MHTDDNTEAEHILNTSNTLKIINYKPHALQRQGANPTFQTLLVINMTRFMHHKMGQNRRAKALGITSVGVGESN